MPNNYNNSYKFIEEDNFIYGKFQPDDHPYFVKIEDLYCDKNSYMLEEAYEAFVSMAEAARLDSIQLKIISATRNFEYQKELWEKKWMGQTLVDNMKLNKSLKNPLERARKILEFKEEKWHWSYIKIAHRIWVNQMDRYSENNLSSFKGYQYVRKLNFAKEYLSSINTCH